MVKDNHLDELVGPEVKPGLMLKWGGHPNGTLIIYGETSSINKLRNYKGMALITKSFFNRLRPSKRFDYGWRVNFNIDFCKQWEGVRMLNEQEFQERENLLYNNPLLVLYINTLINFDGKGNELYYKHKGFEKILSI
ncbi:hypothetical protein KAT80_02080 [Candidatus Pacearchaeota archaeon]|nr:hypothetical protein [Candidatus Pacearchaeota archaeon]